MKTLIATATLTIMFLSAGAFAGNDSQMTAGTKTPVSNVTVIIKNGQWPVKGQTSLDACSVRRCLDA
jgi:hypothetical protein